MSMNEPRDRQPRVSMAGREGPALSERLSDQPRRVDGRSGWILPVVLAAIIIAGIVGFMISGDLQTAGTAPDTTSGQSTQPSTPGSPKAARP